MTRTINQIKHSGMVFKEFSKSAPQYYWHSLLQTMNLDGSIKII